MIFANRASWIALLVLALALVPNERLLAQREDAAREAHAARIRAELPASVPLRSLPVSVSRGPTQLRADALLPGGDLDFSSTTTELGEIVLSLRVSVGADVAPLEAVVAADRQSISWTGHGARITPEQREAIERLSVELELLMLQPGVQPHEEWAWRLTTFWADAPQDVVLNRRTVGEPRDRRRDRSEALSGEPSSQATKSKCASGCNVDSDSRISYLRGKKKNDGCKVASYSTQHDACVDATGNGHCYKSYSVKGGCDLSLKCPGRCGPGCGATGFGIYTLDCLEHDHCVGHDNANACCRSDDKCGDEWFDAGDDLLLAPFVNCEGCK